MINLDRFIIDDARHLPQFVIVEDASTSAGTARFRAECSCGRMPLLPAGTHRQAVDAHIAHVNHKLDAPKGPKWLPLNARIALLLTAMMTVWGGCYAVGQIITHDSALSGAAIKTIVVTAHLTGLLLALTLMVAARRYIAPTRA